MNIAGNVFIACNCDWGCPCNFNARPSKGYCQGGWIWSIEKGEVDGVQVDGLAVALFAKWPGAIHEGGGTAVCFLDERADERQRGALARLLNGELGGPWQIFRGTYTLEGPVPAGYRFEMADLRSKVRIGDAVQLELKPMINPVKGFDIHPEIVLPEGLVVKRAALAASEHFEVRHESVAYDHSGQYTALGRFQYEGAAA